MDYQSGYQTIEQGHGLLYYGIIGIICLVVAVGLIMIIGPIYGVWAAKKAGEADYARATNEQNIVVLSAKSRLAAAQANKDAAIVEAQAVSAQIKEIGDHVKDHPLYLTWQWIEMMRDREGTTVYVPTEANLPILEANREIGKGQSNNA